MAQFTIEAITVVTAVVISTILAIYLFVLKKNGWLGAGSKFYLCPNQECRKVSQKPVELKDLSEIPARIYHACPHCGTNLESVLASCSERKPRLEVKIPLQPKKTGMKIEDSASVLKDYLSTPKNSAKESCIHVRASHRDSEDTMKIETRKPEIAQQTQNSYKKSASEKIESELTVMLGQVRASQAPKKGLPPTQEPTVQTRMIFPSSSDCQYGYGYLSQRDKDEGIPDTCLECPRSLDCMLAEYHKKEETVKEIKKWYSLR